MSELQRLSWRVCVLWECEIKGAGEERLNKVIESIAEWLIGGDSYLFIPHGRTQAIHD